MGVISVDLKNINLGDTNFDEDDFETIIHVRRRPWLNRLKQPKII